MASMQSESRRADRLITVFVGALLALIVGLFAVSRNSVEPLTEEGAIPLVVHDDRYVSSRACRDCHPGKHDSWHESFHRTMTQLATPETVVGNFNDVDLQDQENGRRYHLSRTNKDFLVTIEDTAQGSSETRSVVMTTGSHHMQIYWMSTDQGRALEMLPFTHLLDEQRWVPRRAHFIQPPDEPPEPTFVGHWNTICIKCHTTNGRPQLEGDTLNSVVAEFGIACEACHGPGEQHVQSMQDGAAFPVVDDVIVNPAKLSSRRASQICGSCHGYVIDYKGDYEAFLAHGSPYRPGEDLAKIRPHIAESDNPDRFWSDGTVRLSSAEYNGLIESPCYQRGELSCLSCHMMHQADDDPRPVGQWANDQLKPDMDGNMACLQCHKEYQGQQALKGHTNHEPASSGSLCYNCHMPHSSFGLLKATRVHRIISPDVAVTQKTGRPNACNHCHLDMTLGSTAQYLSKWYGIARPELSEDEESIAASLLWLLRGDAGQRALAAWSMGWQPARAASGEKWITPFLAQLFDDPYVAVRIVAARSLRKLTGRDDIQFDFLASQPDRRAAQAAIIKSWEATVGKTERVGENIGLIRDGGQIDWETVNRLLSQRDNRPVKLLE